MCDFETSVSVWSHTDDPRHLDRNAGCTDILLITGISRNRADALVQQLIDFADLNVLEIRDIHNVCVWSTDGHLVGTDRNASLRPAKQRR